MLGTFRKDARTRYPVLEDYALYFAARAATPFLVLGAEYSFDLMFSLVVLCGWYKGRGLGVVHYL